MTSEQTAKPNRAGRGVKIALGLSLGLNLLILGTIGGAMLTGSPDGTWRDRMDIVRSLGLGPLGLALERDDRDEIIARVSRDRETLRTERLALLQATLAFVDAVEADPFDRAAAAEALEVQRRHIVGLQERGHTALLDQLELMPLTAREGFAERLRRALNRHHGGERR